MKTVILILSLIIVLGLYKIFHANVCPYCKKRGLEWIETRDESFCPNCGLFSKFEPPKGTAFKIIEKVNILGRKKD